MSGLITDEKIFELLQNVYQRTGFDYRDYATLSIKRRIQDAMDIERIKSLDDMSQHIFKSDAAMKKFILTLSVPTTTLFRDPEVYNCIRNKVLPRLSNTSIRIWSAGCSSGEEPYSLSITTKEEGLAKYTRIYATDLNESSIETAKKGIFKLSIMQEYTSNYHLAGGAFDFSDYYTSGYGWAKFHDDIKENLVFSQHNLVTDSSFNEFNLILCRNVMIYFNKDLQDKVHALLFQSLAPGGYLVLGDKENIRFTPFENAYKAVSPILKIYQKME
ncbi:protein-glutamate O-methyltransferase CheR [bacterium]|nr:protein-glutamate O-methyltransferase CheR [bacterium]